MSSLPDVGNRLICKLLENELLWTDSLSECVDRLKAVTEKDFGVVHLAGILSIKNSVRNPKSFEIEVRKRVSLNQACGLWLWGDCRSEYDLFKQAFWGIGNKKLMCQRGKVGIVGTRKSTTYGALVVKELVSRLVDGKLSVWSGFASGIDMAAHQAALKFGVKTVAVAPFLVTAPPHTQRIPIKRILNAGGAVICNIEKPEITKGHFLGRNTLLSKLVDMLFVVEAPLKSGTLHTASECIKRKKPVFVIPGSIFSKSSEGCNNLLTKVGVTIVPSLSFLDKLLGIGPLIETGGVAQELLILIKSGFDTVTSLARGLNLSESKLVKKLTYLELKGILHVNKFGKVFIR
ncbi:DNA-processing protein DprA [Candidatus Dojkabacteria bacterium]|nr:DNA-processing protein DprA [Candidatus Dojkabacteria bacterium]